MAVSPDTDLDDPADVYHAIATRCDPSRDIIIVGNTRGSPYDPTARPIEGQHPWRTWGAKWASMPAGRSPAPTQQIRQVPGLARNRGKVKLESLSL